MLRMFEKYADELGKKLFDAVAKKTSIVISIIQWFADLDGINSKPNIDEWQWFSACLAISFCLVLSIASILLIPASMPTLYAILLGIGSALAINIIKDWLLKRIYALLNIKGTRWEIYYG